MDVYASTQIWSPFEATTTEGLIAAYTTAKGNGWKVIRWELTPPQWQALERDIIVHEDTRRLQGHYWNPFGLLGVPFKTYEKEGRMILREEVTTLAR